MQLYATLVGIELLVVVVQVEAWLSGGLLYPLAPKNDNGVSYTQGHVINFTVANIKWTNLPAGSLTVWLKI